MVSKFIEEKSKVRSNAYPIHFENTLEMEERRVSMETMFEEFRLIRDSNRGFDQVRKRDRRWGIDRRRFSYAAHIPERRMSEDRRRGSQRADVATELTK
jgi:hypothetical protein